MCNVGPMCAGGGSSKIAFLLIAVALGYWVLTLAENNGNPLRLIGRIVGWIVLIAALGGVVCSSMHSICASRMCPTKECPMKPGMMGKMHCETDAAPAPDAPPAPKK